MKVIRSRMYVCVCTRTLSPSAAATQSVSSHSRVTASETHSASCQCLRGLLSYRELPQPRGHWGQPTTVSGVVEDKDLAQPATALMGPAHCRALHREPRLCWACLTTQLLLFALFTPLLTPSPPSRPQMLIPSQCPAHQPLFSVFVSTECNLYKLARGQRGRKIMSSAPGGRYVQGTY